MKKSAKAAQSDQYVNEVAGVYNKTSTKVGDASTGDSTGAWGRGGEDGKQEAKDRASTGLRCMNKLLGIEVRPAGHRRQKKHDPLVSKMQHFLRANHMMDAVDGRECTNSDGDAITCRLACMIATGEGFVSKIAEKVRQEGLAGVFGLQGLTKMRATAESRSEKMLGKGTGGAVMPVHITVLNANKLTVALLEELLKARGLPPKTNREKKADLVRRLVADIKERGEDESKLVPAVDPVLQEEDEEEEMGSTTRSMEELGSSAEEEEDYEGSDDEDEEQDTETAASQEIATAAPTCVPGAGLGEGAGKRRRHEERVQV
jgi:hypothetical protein